MKKLTKEIFAYWSFSRDIKVGALKADDEFDSKEYEEEAEMYLSGGSSIGLPNDIIERANEEGYEIPAHLL